MKRFVTLLFVSFFLFGSFGGVVFAQEWVENNSSPEAMVGSAQESSSSSQQPFQKIANPSNTDPGLTPFPYAFRRSWGGEDVQIHYPRGIDVGHMDNLVLANLRMNSITIINQFFNSIQTIRGSGSSPDEFEWLRNFEIVLDGSFFIANTGNHRIKQIDQYGNVTDIWGSKVSGVVQFEVPLMFTQPEVYRQPLPKVQAFCLYEFLIGIKPGWRIL